MNAEMFAGLTDAADAVRGQFQKVNKLAVANVEKLAGLYVENVSKLCELGVTQLKSAAEVHDARSLQSYLAQQSEAAKALGDMLISGGKKVADMSTDYASGVQGVAHGSIRTPRKKAA